MGPMVQSPPLMSLQLPLQEPSTLLPRPKFMLNREFLDMPPSLLSTKQQSQPSQLRQTSLTRKTRLTRKTSQTRPTSLPRVDQISFTTAATLATPTATLPTLPTAQVFPMCTVVCMLILSQSHPPTQDFMPELPQMY